MSGNTLGKLFTVTSAGESHGSALMAIVDGCPPNIVLNNELIQKELDRRRPGQSKFTTQRRESDQVKILSGVFEGLTTGTPIGLVIFNEDQRTKDYESIKNLFRPSHADYTYHHKYGIRDYRGGGRSSARETAMRVAAGAIAKQVLAQANIQVRAYLSQLGPIKLPFVSWDEVDQNDFFCADPESIPQLNTFMHELRRQQNSVGAEITLVADEVPVGWGEPIFDRLDADLAKALMSINAAKGVAIGAGFDCISQFGNQHRDEMCASGFLSNNSGGIIGGISSGQPIVARVAFKPTPSISLPGQTIDRFGQNAEIIIKGRHDPCVGIRATPIVEAIGALVLLDHWLRQRGQNGEVDSSTPRLKQLPYAEKID